MFNLNGINSVSRLAERSVVESDEGRCGASVKTLLASGARQSETLTGLALLRRQRRKQACPYRQVRTALISLVRAQMRSARMVPVELNML